MKSKFSSALTALMLMAGTALLLSMVVTAAPESEANAKARARAASVNYEDPQENAVGKSAPLSQPKPSVEPTPSPKVVVDPVPTPAPTPSAIPEGYEIYYEQQCNGQTCTLVPRLRPIAKAAKVVGSVLVAPVRAVQNICSAGCVNPDCVCDPCVCDSTAEAYAYATEGAVVYRAAPVRTYFANNQPVRNAGRVAARVVTAPVRFVRNLRCR